MRCSIVLSTRNKAHELRLSLHSIRRQTVPFEHELIVVDDGSTDGTREVCRQYGVDKYYYLRNDRYRNPSKARNVGYRAARGEVVIAQSDDIVHITSDAVVRLVNELEKNQFLLAQVDNWEYRYGQPKRKIRQYCGPKWRKPYFFLGSLWRRDLYAIGGCDEDFVEPCWDDNWFADCLMKGLGLGATWTTRVKAHHISHTHYHSPDESAGSGQYGEATHRGEKDSEQVYLRKVAAGVFCSSGGPWELDGPVPDISSMDEPLPAVEVPVERIDEQPTVEEHPALVGLRRPSPARRDRAEDGRIPKRVNFFWAGNKLSWMRYMTLHSFRRYHAEWDILLWRPYGKTLGGKAWRSSETQDSQIYDGPCYLDRLRCLGVEVRDWALPIDELAPSHACDLCQWDILSGEGGWYADMDVLWVAPLPYDAVREADAVFCLTSGFMAIGLMASAPGCRLFADVSAMAFRNYDPTKYQSTGAEAVYRLAGIWPWWGSFDAPGRLAFNSLRTRYEDLEVVNLPEQTVYPWDYTSVSSIFVEDNRVPEGCCGIHWFGGNNLSQEWNGRLTHANYIQCGPNTYTRYAEELTR